MCAILVGTHSFFSMLISPYAILFEKEKKYYAFCTLTKALLELDDKTYADLLKIGGNEIVEGFHIEESDLKVLYDSHIICNDLQEEYDLCKSMILNDRNDETDMHITIAPTMDCCFSCFYCFERQKEPSYMTRGIADSIIKFIKTQKKLKTLHVTWFGGEPLMAVHIIEYFTKNLLDVFSGVYTSEIITTALFIDEGIIDILKNAKITEMQISIDGQEKTHNSIKHTPKCQNAFLRTMGNIELLNKLYPDLAIGIRVNMTKKNQHEFKDLYFDILKRFNGTNVSIFPGFIVNRNNITLTNLFTHNEISEFSLKIWEINKIPTPWIIYSKDQGECAIRKKNSWVFDASANVYKCWEKVGDKKFKIGKLEQNGQIVCVNHGQLDRYLYGADPLYDEKCMCCNVLPICFGGCPIQRIENFFDKKDNIVCSSYKGNIVRWLSAYLDFMMFFKNNDLSKHR